MEYQIVLFKVKESVCSCKIKQFGIKTNIEYSLSDYPNQAIPLPRLSWQLSFLARSDP